MTERPPSTLTARWTICLIAALIAGPNAGLNAGPHAALAQDADAQDADAQTPSEAELTAQDALEQLGAELNRDIDGFATYACFPAKATNKDVDHLLHLPRLTYVELSKTAVDDAGISKLKGLKTLDTLHLWDTKVTDAAMSDIRQIKKLKTLESQWHPSY